LLLVIVALVLLGDLGTTVIWWRSPSAVWFGHPDRFFAVLVTVTVLAATYFASIDGERARSPRFATRSRTCSTPATKPAGVVRARLRRPVRGRAVPAGRNRVRFPAATDIFAIIGEAHLVGAWSSLLLVTLACGSMRIALRTSDTFVGWPPPGSPAG
jgi:hypothetical protein